MVNKAEIQTLEMMLSIKAELAAARAAWPTQSVWVTLSALTEEVGELNKAVLKLNFEPHGDEMRDHKHTIYREAVQVATMAIRVALDCHHLTEINEEGQ